MSKKNDSWKRKIDPCFDEAIKTYISLLDLIEKTDDQLALHNSLQAVACNNPEHLNLTVEKPSNEIFFAFVKEAEFFGREFYAISQFPKDATEIAGYLKNCIKCASTLPEESERFYTEKIGAFLNIPPDTPPQAVQKAFEALVPTILLLAFRVFFIGLAKTRDEIKEDDVPVIIKLNLVSEVVRNMQRHISLISYQRTIEELIEQGDDASLLKAISVDKNILYSDAVRTRVLNAQTMSDTDFFKALGRAISKKPLDVPSIHGKTCTVLRLLWPVLSPVLTAEEIYYLLKDSGLIPPLFPDGFYKLIRRHITPLLTPLFKAKIS